VHSDLFGDVEDRSLDIYARKLSLSFPGLFGSTGHAYMPFFLSVKKMGAERGSVSGDS
jgi:hypothetical protein